MSIVQNPITGRTSGKFATAVFSKNFQKNTMRSLPIEVSNPKTDAQVSQRTAYKQILDCVSSLNAAVAIGMKNAQNKMSPFSFAMSKSLNDAITGNPGNRIVNLLNVKISQGPLLPLQNLNKTFNVVNGATVLNWTKGIASTTNYLDARICVAVFDALNNYSYINENVAIVDDETASFTLDETKITNDTVMFIFPYADKSFIDMSKPRPKKFAAGTQLATKVK